MHDQATSKIGTTVVTTSIFFVLRWRWKEGADRWGETDCFAFAFSPAIPFLRSSERLERASRVALAVKPCCQSMAGWCLRELAVEQKCSGARTG